MNQPLITHELVLETIKDPKNKTRKLWTASVVLDRLGIYRKFESGANYNKQDRRRVKKLLEELYQAGHLVIVKEQHTLHSATANAEVAYGLPEECF